MSDDLREEIARRVEADLMRAFWGSGGAPEGAPRSFDLFDLNLARWKIGAPDVHLLVVHHPDDEESLGRFRDDSSVTLVPWDGAGWGRALVSVVDWNAPRGTF